MVKLSSPVALTGGLRRGSVTEMSDEAGERRHGWLKNGNPVGDFSKSPRCGAKTRRGTPCGCPAMKNKHGVYTKCRLHGGLSRGPKTPEGLHRSRTARLKHGGYSQE